MAHDDELTAEEREALERLPREQDPGRLLEERTVAALKACGLLGERARGHGPDRGRMRGRAGGDRVAARGVQPAWWAAGVAAAMALFFAGLALGQARSSAATRDLVLALRTAEASERPTLVQETGSLYVDAVASLATARESGDEAAVGTGTEVGIAALYAAAYELARLNPQDPRLREVLRALEPPATQDATAAGVHWF